MDGSENILVFMFMSSILASLIVIVVLTFGWVDAGEKAHVISCPPRNRAIVVAENNDFKYKKIDNLDGMTGLTGRANNIV